MDRNGERRHALGDGHRALDPQPQACRVTTQSRAFLDVERSLTGRRWVARLEDLRTAEAIAQTHDVPEVLGRVLAARGVAADTAESYLNPTLRALMPKPSAIADMEAGAARLADAIVRRERIGIITDYDVDGMASAALLMRYLRSLGSDVAIHIPDRLSEGYGPSVAAVERLRKAGAQLLVTLDCGVGAHDPLAKANELGLDTVIVDHHQPGQTLPVAAAVINPNRNDDISGLGHLCAAGLTFILIGVCNRLLRARGQFEANRPEPNLLQWLEFVALATVCDVVPLVGLNRAYVTQGLKIMARRNNPGLAALADVARLKRRPDTYALGYLLGPRLNAAGRIDRAQRGVDLLMADDHATAMPIAQELEALNRERQSIELGIVEEAIAQTEAALGRERALPVVVAAGEGWHPGVLGLVAARLKERFDRPALALGYAPNETFASGSGRSIAGIDLGAAVRAALEAGIVAKGGGHAMAAGLSVARERIGDLRAFLEARIGGAPSLTAQRLLRIDGALSASGASLDLIELLEQAGPYGAGNPAPVFALPAHRVAWADSAGSDHVRLMLQAADGSRLKAVAFRALNTELGEVLLSERQFPLHVAGRLQIDDWNGRREAALHLEDAARITT
jgi:single-stranded-DNA-specific exonuclease